MGSASNLPESGPTGNSAVRLVCVDCGALKFPDQNEINCKYCGSKRFKVIIEEPRRMFLVDQRRVSPL